MHFFSSPPAIGPERCGTPPGPVHKVGHPVRSYSRRCGRGSARGITHPAVVGRLGRRRYLFCARPARPALHMFGASTGRGYTR